MRMKTLSTIICAAGVTVGTAGAQESGVQSTQRSVARGTVVDFPAPSADPAAASRVPQRGMDQQDVLTAFGSPSERHTPVGDPPITRWDYPGFRVYFEYDLVLHAVVPGNFPEIHHRDQLASGR